MDSIQVTAPSLDSEASDQDDQKNLRVAKHKMLRPEDKEDKMVRLSYDKGA